VQAKSARGGIELIQLFASTSFVGRSDLGGRYGRAELIVRKCTLFSVMKSNQRLGWTRDEVYSA
jgi:hypothetical protein